MSTTSDHMLQKLPDTVREAITTAYRAKGGLFSVFGDAQKRAMAQSIFDVENELEHRQGATPPSKRAVVNELRRRRNVLLDELGENEVPNRRRSI